MIENNCATNLPSIFTTLYLLIICDMCVSSPSYNGRYHRGQWHILFTSTHNMWLQYLFVKLCGIMYIQYNFHYTTVRKTVMFMVHHVNSCVSSRQICDRMKWPDRLLKCCAAWCVYFFCFIRVVLLMQMIYMLVRDLCRLRCSKSKTPTEGASFINNGPRGFTGAIKISKNGGCKHFVLQFTDETAATLAILMIVIHSGVHFSLFLYVPFSKCSGLKAEAQTGAGEFTDRQEEDRR